MRATLVLTLVLALAACGDTSDDTPAGNNGGNNGDAAGVSCDGDVCTLSGTLTEDLTLTPDKAWLLRGGVFIGDDESETVLTIEPGTTIYGESATAGMLVIRRGSKIMAEGTKDAPIVFTSSKEDGSRARGDWGGIIINGRAKVNSCADDEAENCESFGEGGTGFYGGSDDEDNSGVLRYVRVEFGGRLVSPDNELNGIAFQAVGSGTTIEYIQIHMNKDDGIEFFGGTAQFKYILTTGIADDNLDWTDGWRGKGQFFVAQQYDDAGDNGIEADNSGEDNAASPRSMPTLSNVTLVGSPDSEFSDNGALLREGTAGHLTNVVATGWNDSCLDIDHDETFNNGGLTVTHWVVSCASNFTEDDGEPSVEELYNADETNMIADPMLKDPFNLDAPDFRLTGDSPAMTGAEQLTDGFFDKVGYRGAFDGENDWTAGWTTHARN